MADGPTTSWWRGCALAGGIALLWSVGHASAAGPSYDERRADAVRACQAIDPSASQSGLFFNPAGYRSFYLQSACVQDAAVQYRDESLCAHVRQRWSLFSSSWGYSEKRCRALVSAGLDADHQMVQELKRRFSNDPVRLREVRVERDGNGRDVDVIPLFSGTFAHGYTLRLEVLTTTGPRLISSSGYYLDGKNDIRIFIRQADIAAAVPQFQLASPYRLRSTLMLDIGMGGQSGYWSDTFIERTFPVRERVQTLEGTVRF